MLTERTLRNKAHDIGCHVTIIRHQISHSLFYIMFGEHIPCQSDSHTLRSNSSIQVIIYRISLVKSPKVGSHFIHLY